MSASLRHWGKSDDTIELLKRHCLLLSITVYQHFLDNSSRIIITLRSVSFIQFDSLVFDFAHINFITVKNTSPFVPIF